MDYKECNSNQYERKNRFHNKIKNEALQLLSQLKCDLPIRYAIQMTKEAGRRGISGESLGRVFKGNSNKYCKNWAECRIINKVQRRNNQKKSQQAQQI
ncbi:unnamed protein product [Paramecium octaurelia]|uniref:Uncharacterized protein n=1 Tax=Paramecium octaurelia TaxID=43137 RepID=A0A8S1YJM8_PAROT|nr:unnamed protein product [Paramecium octaurelia]